MSLAPQLSAVAPLVFRGSPILVSAVEELDEVPSQIQSDERPDYKKRDP
jgi:hypothetical protein